MLHSVEVDLGGGTKLSIETGRMAKQASGSVVVRSGDSVVLVSAVSAPEPKVGASFFPLTVDYREYTYSAGRFPGGFIKREGRPTEKEILTSRLIDRPIRPLFPEGYSHETQVIGMVLSADPKVDPSTLAIVGAGAALAISDMPFHHILGLDLMQRSELPRAEQFLHRACNPAQNVELMDGLVDERAASFGLPASLDGARVILGRPVPLHIAVALEQFAEASTFDPGEMAPQIMKIGKPMFTHIPRPVAQVMREELPAEEALRLQVLPIREQTTQGGRNPGFLE